MNPQHAPKTALTPPDADIEESPDGGDSGRPTLEIADILRRFGPQYQALHALSSGQARTLSDLTLCRTEVMGGHTTTCGDCGVSDSSFNSCRNRSCPKCQGQLSRIWVEAQILRVLETPYFHAVFTVPAELRPLFLANRRLLFNLLMKTAAETLLELCVDPKRRDLRPALTLVLHTWSQDLSFHPHVHCIVSSGGLSVDGTRWVNARGKGDFLLPMKVVTKLFRGKFMDGVMALEASRELKLADECARRVGCGTLLELKDKLYKTQWLFYAKRPFGGPEQVLKYLGQYTHRTGISNRRLRHVDEDGVRFAVRGGGEVTLKPLEFVRRFLSHVLPVGFKKIRHYGLLAPAQQKERLEAARRLLAELRPPKEEVTQAPLELVCPRPAKKEAGVCAHCGSTNLHTLRILRASRGPTEQKKQAHQQQALRFRALAEKIGYGASPARAG